MASFISSPTASSLPHPPTLVIHLDIQYEAFPRFDPTPSRRMSSSAGQAWTSLRQKSRRFTNPDLTLRHLPRSRLQPEWRCEYSMASLPDGRTADGAVVDLHLQEYSLRGPTRRRPEMGKARSSRHGN